MLFAKIKHDYPCRILTTNKILNNLQLNPRITLTSNKGTYTRLRHSEIQRLFCNRMYCHIFFNHLFFNQCIFHERSMHMLRRRRLLSKQKDHSIQNGLKLKGSNDLVSSLFFTKGQSVQSVKNNACGICCYR